MRYFIIFVFLFWNLGLASQSASTSYTILEEARELAVKEHRYDIAISMVVNELVDKPEDAELKLFLSRLYFWSHNLNRALLEVQEYMELDPIDYDAHKLLIDIYESGRNFQTCTEKIRKALIFYPQDAELEFRLAYNLFMATEYEESLEVILGVLENDPDNKRAQHLKNEIRLKTRKNFLFVEYRHFFLNTDEQRLEFQHLQYARIYPRLTLIPNVTTGRSIDAKGFQYGLDCYNTLGKKVYTYFSARFSKSILFPTLRINGALYFALPRDASGSVMISLIQADNKNIRIISPSITKNITKSSITATLNMINHEFSNELTYRIRFRQHIYNLNNHVGISYGSFSSNETIQSTEVVLSAKYVSYEAQVSLGKKISLGLNYNRNITKGVDSRDQLFVYAKHLF